jgi:hypothetical protein
LKNGDVTEVPIVGDDEKLGAPPLAISTVFAPPPAVATGAAPAPPPYTTPYCVNAAEEVIVVVLEK